jgi:site-specific DNA-methyltransferase (adenine-specific)
MPYVECDAAIFDPPYSGTVHRAGALIEGKDGAERSVDIGYEAFDEVKIEEVCKSWSPRVRSWMCIHTSHDLIPIWEHFLRAQGRYVFAPVPCVMPGMSVRLRGDGPSSWAVYLIAARPREKRFMQWGTLRGAYIGSPPSRNNKRKSVVMGQKPQWMIDDIVSDYSRIGDLVVDPFTGSGTTGVACRKLGRDFIGSELDAETYDQALARVNGAAPAVIDGGQADLFG